MHRPGVRIVRYADPNLRYGVLESDGAIRPLAASPYESLEPRGRSTRVEKVRLLAPVEPRNVARLVAYMYSAMTLLPGDVILTGTPSGVGPIHPGDVVEIESAPIGILRNTVVRET